MDYIFSFAHPYLLYSFIPVLIALAYIRLKYRKGVRYTYPLADDLQTHQLSVTHPYKKIIFALRFIMLALLAMLIAKPQLIDPRTNITVEGIDIVLVLDISGSMSLPHHKDDERTRIEVAKEEAIRFVEKRTNDAIGVVVFGTDALSRCPLTVDKTILKEIIADINIGLVNSDHTVLSKSIVTAANRLRRSTAKSKIIILLTDGEPSEIDIKPEIAIDVAKQMGIKIYTIGIGDNLEFIQHTVWGPRIARTTLNKALLSKMADETCGRFFEAKNAQEMRSIYDTIDRLERTEIEAPVFSRAFDWFMPFLIAACVLFIFELLLTTFIWFGI